MAKTQDPVVAVITSQTKAAATVARGRWDLSEVDVGLLTVAITNGATAPTGNGATGRVMIAHKQAAGMPAAGAVGAGSADWKLYGTVSGGTINSARTDVPFRFGPEVAYLQVEFSAHTGTDITVEAYGTPTSLS